ncbi:hypothetical protein PG988_003155 [Apiospora saccharicola]
MSDPRPAAVQEAVAIAAAIRASNTELWTLYAFALAATALRTYSRVKFVGICDLRADDYLVWVAIALYTTLSTLAYVDINYGQGLANNGMIDAQRESLDLNSMEYDLRVFGSKVQVAGWTIYGCLICSLKLAVLFFYIRLTEGIGPWFRKRILAGFALVMGTWLACMITLYSGAISRPLLWVNLTASVLTDICLIMIPLPMLWGSGLKLSKKIASSFVLSAGIFVLICSVVKTSYLATASRKSSICPLSFPALSSALTSWPVKQDSVNGAQLAGAWGTREAFTSVVTTNLPMLFPLLKNWFRPLLSTFSSSKSSNTTGSNLTVFKTIGGSDGLRPRDIIPRKLEPASSKNKHDITLVQSDSQERIVDKGAYVREIEISA